jgi:hypothetical protein
MLIDVKLAAEGIRPIELLGRAGGFVLSVEDVMDKVRALLRKGAK